MTLDQTFASSIQGVTVIEEDIGAVSTILAKQIGAYASSVGKKVCYLSVTAEGRPLAKKELLGVMAGTSRGEVGGEFLEQSSIVIKIEPNLLSLQDLKFDLIIFESFSSFLFEKQEREIIEAVNEIRRLVSSGRNFVLLVETPVLSPNVNAYVRSMADNIIIIRTDVLGDKINRLLYIPKMKGTQPANRLTKFTIEQDGIQVDTREFVG